MSRRHGHTPKYSLKRIKELLAAGEDFYLITQSARLGAQRLYMDDDDIVACVWALGDDDYETTLEGTRVPGTFQDVYRTRHHGFRIYLKVRLIGDHEAVIISFKQDTSA